jgi:hypothetical protein
MARGCVTQRDENPYVGPRPFERSDRAFFFGRDGEARELLSLVVAERVVLLYAASGAGKTSLVHAALVPLLEEEEGFEVLPVARIRAQMSDDALASSRNVYSAGVLASLAEAAGDGHAEGEFASSTLAEFLARHPHAIDSDGLTEPRALVIDQFEELFTLYPRYWRQREQFVRDLADALDDDPLLRVVLAMREDYVAQLDPFTPLLPRDLRTRLRLDRLGPADAIAAVVNPTHMTKRTYAPGVAEKLVADLLRFRADTGLGETVEIEGEYVEPVHLQVVCQSLWEELPPDVTEITEGHLRAFGDVDEVLRRFYDDAVESAAARARMREARLRARLENLFITAVGTRNTVYRTADATAGLPNAAIDELENRRVIRAEWRAGARWYELTHDRLIAPIQSSNARFRARVGRRRRTRALAAVAVAAAGIAVLLAALVLIPGAAPQQTLSLSVDAIVLNVPRAYVGGPPRSRSGTAATVQVATQELAGKTVVLSPSVVTNGGSVVARGQDVAVAAAAAGRATTTAAVWLPQPRARGVYRIAIAGRTIEGGPTDNASSPSFRIGLAGRLATVAPGSSALALSTIGRGRVSAGATQPCPPACTYVYSRGKTVALTALPNQKSRFIGWTGCRSKTESCSVRVARSTAVTARFTWLTRLLGRTRKGSRITAVEVGDPAAKRKVVIVGCARLEACQGQAIADALTRMAPPPGVDLWVIKNLNPDGVGDPGHAAGKTPATDFPCRWARPSAWSKDCLPLRVPSEREGQAAYRLILDKRPELTIWYTGRTPKTAKAETGKKYPKWVNRGWTTKAQENLVRRFARLVDLKLGGGKELEPSGGFPGHPATWQRRALPNTNAFYVMLPVGPLSSADAEKHAKAILTVAQDL